jgi:hypothetical protein
MNSVKCTCPPLSLVASLVLFLVVGTLKVWAVAGEEVEPTTIDRGTPAERDGPPSSVIAGLLQRGVISKDDLSDPQTLDALPLLLQCERLRDNTAQTIEAAIQNFHGMVVGIRPSPAFHAYETRYRQLKVEFASFSATLDDISTLSVTSSVGRKLFECHGEIDSLLTYPLTVHLHMGPDIDARQETKGDARVVTAGGGRSGRSGRSVKATSPSVSIAQRVKAELAGYFRDGWRYASLILRGRFGAPDENIITEEEGFGGGQDADEDESEDEVV